MAARWRAGIVALALLAGGAASGGETPPTPSPAPSPSPAAPSPSPGQKLGAVVELSTHPAAYIEAKAGREQIYGAIMGDLVKVRDAVAKAGLTPTGHAQAVFLSADDDGFTYRALIPLESLPTPAPALAKPVTLGQTPVGKAMKFEYRGEYDEIDSTYDAITAYLDEKGIDAQDVFVEEYLNEPKSPDDPNGEVDIYVLMK